MSVTHMIRVLVVDDHPAVRSGVRALLAGESDMQVVAEARSGEEALELFDENDVSVSVLDVNLPGIDGWQTTLRIRARSAAALVILISMFGVSNARSRAEKVGARGLLLKTSLRVTLTPAIRSVFNGGTAFPG